jgi:hypothetical protein
MAGGKAGEGGGHFLGGMGVAGASGGGDSGGKGLACLGEAREPHVKLAELEVTGDVVGVRAKQNVEVLDGGVGIARVGAFKGEAVKGKGVVGARGDELFQFLAASSCWLWLGHGVRGSIIGGLVADAN